MRAISDDYEGVELILASVHRSNDPAATPEEVFIALAELVKDGLAQAYELSPHPPHATVVDIDPERMEELWFYATPKGIACVTEINNRELTTDN